MNLTPDTNAQALNVPLLAMVDRVVTDHRLHDPALGEFVAVTVQQDWPHDSVPEVRVQIASGDVPRAFTALTAWAELLDEPVVDVRHYEGAVHVGVSGTLSGDRVTAWTIGYGPTVTKLLRVIAFQRHVTGSAALLDRLAEAVAL
ncbi:hypothetical protein AB0425_17785 [Actinosynnema sp. NPDC051121]